MSAHRRPEIRFSDAPRGSCRWCGDLILHPPGPKHGKVNYRRRWHVDCLGVWEATDPRELRFRVRKRDHGVCCECGLRTERLRREVRGKGRAAKLRNLGFLPRRSLWELDHIVALIDGGTHELSNLQTLCVPCHRRKSAKENSDRAARVRDERLDGAASTNPSPPALRDRPRRVDIEELGARLDAAMARADQANRRAEALLEGDPLPRGRRAPGLAAEVGVTSPQANEGPFTERA